LNTKNKEPDTNKKTNSQTTANQETSTSSQQSEIENLRKEVEILKNVKPKVIIKEAPVKQGSTIASIVSYWKPRIAYVECYFKNQSNPQDYLTMAGSGLFMGNYSDDPNSFYVLTNAHVAGISNNRGTFAADYCKLQLQDDPDIMTSSKISAASGWRAGTDFQQDVAIITIANPTASAKKLTTKTQFCTDLASIGEEIIVLGYPSIGSSEEITATKGVVSSYEGYYYITDAKIDHGNSGGAAILANKNCYLGIPTAAVAGEIESLGRILDAGTALSWLAH